jgi:hypothetical protein
MKFFCLLRTVSKTAIFKRVSSRSKILSPSSASRPDRIDNLKCDFLLKTGFGHRRQDFEKIGQTKALMHWQSCSQTLHIHEIDADPQNLSLNANDIECDSLQQLR